MTEYDKQIEGYKATKAVFTDYTRFEGDNTVRTEQRQAFINDVRYTPEYDYGKLEAIQDDEALRNKKAAIYEAIIGLEAAKREPGANMAELEIYASYFEVRLQKIMLVEGARALRHAGTSSEREVAINTYHRLNEETYGEYNTEVFDQMLDIESQKASAFEPTTKRAASIKEGLQRSIGERVASHNEEPLLDNELFERLQSTINERYAVVLAAVPETGDDHYYNAEECAAIMTVALEAGGLADKGWKITIDPAKPNPSTSAAKRTIALPSSTRRTAAELRRLIVHEQEVHARRGENGRETGFEPLKNGTADYADVEEGLGVLFECATAGDWDNASFNRARDRYITAGLALGADGAPRDARQVYETMWRMLAIREAQDGDISDESIEKAKQLAYTHVENAFRGSDFWGQGVIYTKLKVYYEGLKKNADYIKQHAENINEAIDQAMIGKYDHTNERECADVSAVLAERASV